MTRKRKGLTKKSLKTKQALTTISSMKRTIELSETKNETMPSVIKKKLKTTHAWLEPIMIP
ncbi:hypothetical protein VN0837_02040 [Helicobacter pylori]